MSTRTQTMEKAFDAVADELFAISEWMYEHPEIGWEEHESSAILADFLRRHGFEVSHPAWDLATAFDARIGDGGPELVICAEYDALPEVGHACGHNIIATAALGAGAALASITAELPFTLRILGTPAEEGGGGKVELINRGAFATTDAAMMIHPAPDDLLDPEFLATSRLDVTYRGRESHAAFAPQLGRNALDAAVLAYSAIGLLRQRMTATDRVHGIIASGGESANVIPAYTNLKFLVRSDRRESLAELEAAVRACFEGAAVATGTEVEIGYSGHSYDGMRTDPELADLFAANAARLGRTMPRSPAPGTSIRGSTDMANVSNVVPSIHPMIGIDSYPAVNHQKEFAQQTITEAGRRAIRDGALAMAGTVVDYVQARLRRT